MQLIDLTSFKYNFMVFSRHSSRIVICFSRGLFTSFHEVLERTKAFENLTRSSFLLDSYIIQLLPCTMPFVKFEGSFFSSSLYSVLGCVQGSINIGRHFLAFRGWCEKIRRLIICNKRVCSVPFFRSHDQYSFSTNFKMLQEKKKIVARTLRFFSSDLSFVL